MSRLIYSSTLLFLCTFVFVEIASAELIRSGGRGSLSRQFTTNYFFVENADIVHFSDSVGMSVEAYERRFSTPFFSSIGGGGRGVSALPTSGSDPDTNCNGSYDTFELGALEDDLDNAQDEAAYNAALQALEALQTGSPCAWEFEQGEDLLTFGNFSMFFDTPLITHDVNWNISGNGGNFDLSGSINTGSDINTADGIISFGQIFLDAVAPQQLTVGDYELRVSVDVRSNFGEFFFQRNNPSGDSSVDEISLERYEENNPAFDAWIAAREAWERDVLFPWQDSEDPNKGPEPVFDQPEPEEVLVGYRSVDFSGPRSAEMRFTSVSEILRIIPADDNPTIPVNAPATSLLFMIGGLGLWFRHRFEH